MRRRKREHLNWFPPAEAALKRTLAHHIISVLLRSHLHVSHRLPAKAGMAPFDVTIAALNFASLSSPSFLANSYTFLIGIWRIIRNLARFALAMVLGRRRRVLFLVRLKNRSVFSPSSLCLHCNAHGSGGILFVQGEKRVPRLMGVEDGPLRVPYIESEIWGSSLPTEFKERMSSKMNSTRFPREPSVSKFAPLHKSTIECASRIPKQSTLSPKRKH